MKTSMIIWSLFPFHLGIDLFFITEEFNYSGDDTQMDEEIAKFSPQMSKITKRLLQASKKIFDEAFRNWLMYHFYSLVNDEATLT